MEAEQNVGAEAAGFASLWSNSPETRLLVAAHAGADMLLSPRRQTPDLTPPLTPPPGAEGGIHEIPFVVFGETASTVPPAEANANARANVKL